MALRNFVNGGYVDAMDGRTSDVIDPSTGEPYDQAPLSGAADVDAAMSAAASAFEGWRDATPQERSLAVLRIAEAVEARAEELVQAECRDTGKPLQLTREDHGRAMRMAKRLDFGAVWINTHIPFASEMPHGGFKHSGYGKDLSMYGFEDYTRIKHVMSHIGA